MAGRLRVAIRGSRWPSLDPAENLILLNLVMRFLRGRWVTPLLFDTLVRVDAEGHGQSAVGGGLAGGPVLIRGGQFWLRPRVEVLGWGARWRREAVRGNR